MRILISDDDLGSRLVAQSAVRRLGHECVVAHDGLEAWQLLSQAPVDVLITDREMPGLDGLTLCRRLREQEQQDEGYTYIILLTGLDQPDQVTDGMLAGADDYLSKPLNPFDLQTRLFAAERVTQLHAELARARGALALQAHTDPLTGLRNRLGLATELEHLHDVAARYGRSYCVAMCDIDRFKAYNDTYGHPAGDEALRLVAAHLTEQVRRGDRVYRYGGEEFLVLLPEQGLAQAGVAMERIRSDLQALTVKHLGAEPDGVLTLSIGVAGSTPGRRVPSADLVAEADAALYLSKRTGRNLVTLHETS